MLLTIKNFDPYASHTLAYPEGSEVLTIPGQPSQLFQLDKHKKDISKPYNRITLYLVERHFSEVRDNDQEPEPDFDLKNQTPSTSTTTSSSCVIEISDEKETLESSSLPKSRSSCFDNDKGKSSRITGKNTQIVTLKEIFPSKNEVEFKSALDTTNSLEEPVSLHMNSNQSLNELYGILITDDFQQYDTLFDEFDDGFSTVENTAAQSKLICNGTFRHKIASLDKNEFCFCGQLTVVRLLQEFQGLKYFSKTVVDYILIGEIGNLKPSIEEIPNTDVKESLQKLLKITDEEAFKNEASFDCRFEAGNCKPFVYLQDKEDLCRFVSLRNVILSSVTEINQYMEGLKNCGILNS